MPQHTTSTPRGLFSDITWPLVLGLGALALIRPLLRVTGIADALAQGGPLVPVSTTVLITVSWVAAVLVARVPRPFLTLVHTGVAYGVLAVALSAVLSPILDGRLQGPLTDPFALVMVLVLNAGWGAAAGGIALGIRGLTGGGVER
ncbi:hypothetical protein [Nocardiopsis listeri]|uniref:hypothetical protein n=1 Tax=Nocardiopsis listeri TaxID=53440 RepID=UPI00082BB8C3|nr:hypothetical protein [Nocardiopsis listeri]